MRGLPFFSLMFALFCSGSAAEKQIALQMDLRAVRTSGEERVGAIYGSVQMEHLAPGWKSSVSLYNESSAFRNGLVWSVFPELSGETDQIVLDSSLQWSMPLHGPVNGTEQENSRSSLSTGSRHTLKPEQACFFSRITTPEGGVFIPAARGSVTNSPSFAFPRPAVLHLELKIRDFYVPDQCLAVTVPFPMGKGKREDRGRVVTAELSEETASVLKLRIRSSRIIGKRKDGSPVSEGTEMVLYLRFPPDSRWHIAASVMSWCCDRESAFCGRKEGKKEITLRYCLLPKNRK